MTYYNNEQPHQQSTAQEPDGQPTVIGFWVRLHLAWLLFWDRRVRILAKLFPVLAIVYVLSPVDLVPELVLGLLGALDDLAILVLGINMLIWLSPPHVIAEYLRELGSVKAQIIVDGDIIDAPRQ